MVAPVNNNERNSYFYKPPIFDGERFEYWKDRLESFFLGYDADLWDLITDGYREPISEEGIPIPKSQKSED